MFQIRPFLMKDLKYLVRLLEEEWDLGKTLSHSKGHVCGWFYDFQILKCTDKFNRKVGGV